MERIEGLIRQCADSVRTAIASVVTTEGLPLPSNIWALSYRRRIATGIETPVTPALYQILFGRGFSQTSSVPCCAVLTYVSRKHPWKHIYVTKYSFKKNLTSPPRFGTKGVDFRAGAQMQEPLSVARSTGPN